MIPEVINRHTGDRMTVELEIGALLWLRASSGDLVPGVKRDDLPWPWEYVGAEIASDALGFQPAGAGVSPHQAAPAQHYATPALHSLSR